MIGLIDINIVSLSWVLHGHIGFQICHTLAPQHRVGKRHDNICKRRVNAYAKSDGYQSIVVSLFGSLFVLVVLVFVLILLS